MWRSATTPVATASRKVTDVAARSDPGLVRERNEDRWLVRSYAGTTLLAVADGVGGEDGGEVASAAAVAALSTSFVPPSYRQSARISLSDAVRAANTAVLDAATQEQLPRAATTLVAAAVRGRDVAVANLGDSRGYLVRGANIRQITTDHSGDAASSITRFAGDPRGVQPDIFVETLEPSDRLVLCSDGLTRHITDDEIAAAVARPSAAAAADALIALTRTRGAEDNVTVVIYAAGRSGIPRALIGTLILALLLLVAMAGALGALVTTPLPRPAVSATPSIASPSATPSAAPSPSVAPAPTP